MSFVEFQAVALTCVLAAASAQNVDPKLAKILKEQRFNAGDGRAGAAFQTEDGVIFKEETDLDGNRIGQYSYIGDDGNTYTVRYSAGKDGFRILDGAHIPSGGQGAAAFVAETDDQGEAILPPPSAPVPARPVPKDTRPVLRVVPEPAPAPVQEFPDYDDAPVDPNFNPFINPHDPTHRDFRFNKNAVKFNPNSPLAQQQSLVPPCADCENVNPFINPFDATHQAGAGLLAGHLAGHQAGVRRPSLPAPVAPRRQQAPAPRPRPAAAVPAPRAQPVLRQTTPPPQRNFFPPGQLKLNRFETGFNFDFES